jgi:hypothetical protein
MTTTVRSLARNRAASASWGASPEALEAYNTAKQALTAMAKERWDDPEFHREIARDIQTEVDYGFTHESLFGNYFNVEQVGFEDRVILRERRGLKVFFTSRGGYIEESQLRDETWELPRDTFGFHVSEHLDKLMVNFGDTIEELVVKGTNRMEAEVYRRALALMQAAIPSGSPFYTSAAGLTKASLDAELREVADAIQPDGTGYIPITIMGRAQMVDQILDFDFGFDPEANAEIRRRGQLGVYRGANIVRLHNYQDEDGAAYVPANELWVFGGNVGKFALYGGSQVKAWDENTVDYRHYRARRDMGGLVHHPEQARRFVDTSITP